MLEDATIERVYGWVFFAQTKEYIESRDISAIAIGSGGTLVEKQSGRCIEFGSAFSTETNLKIYEAGYLDHPDFDLLITEVSQIQEAVRLLDQLAISYVVPEVSNGTAWRIPKAYTQQQLSAKLSRLPCRLNVGSLYFKWQVVEEMKTSPALKFSLLPNDGSRNEI